MTRRSRTGKLTSYLAAALIAGLLILLVVLELQEPTLNSGNSGKVDNEPTRVTHPSLLMGAATGRCGVELWSIKTMTDADASRVELAPKPTTIQDLAATQAPPDVSGRPRDAPVETATWQVSAILTGFKLEGDSDYHLVLDDGHGHSMIAEIPDPSCAQGSRVLPSIVDARQTFEAHGYNASTECFGCLSQPVTVDGVGFFDRLHGQTGVAPNGVELHPVLSLSFGGQPPSPTTSQSTTSAITSATTTTSPTCRDRDRRADAREFRHFIPRSDPDLRDDLRERRQGGC